MKNSRKITIKHGTLDDLEFPPILYKYRNWSDKFHKRFITEKEVFMASARDFEDQLDCYNPTRFDLLTDGQIYQQYLWDSKKMNPNFTQNQHVDFAKMWSEQTLIKDKAHVEKWMKETREQYYEHDGILSLTENWNNDAMWKKYSDNGKGFCIGYNTRELFRHIGGGGQVQYVDILPIILPAPFMSFPEAMRNRVYCKLKHWEFEEEYRTRKFYKYPATLIERQIKLPKETFNKIILGDNISEVDRQEIIAQTKLNIGEIETIDRKNAT